jgi:hypothetical protein
LSGEYASLFKPNTMRGESQMRSFPTLRLLPRMPGRTNTAGLSLAGGTTRAFGARAPLDSSPAQDSGPIGRKRRGSSSTSALVIAAADVSLPK